MYPWCCRHQVAAFVGKIALHATWHKKVPHENTHVYIYIYAIYLCYICCMLYVYMLYAISICYLSVAILPLPRTFAHDFHILHVIEPMVCLCPCTLATPALQGLGFMVPGAEFAICQCDQCGPLHRGCMFRVPLVYAQRPRVLCQVCQDLCPPRPPLPKKRPKPPVFPSNKRQKAGEGITQEKS